MALIKTKQEQDYIKQACVVTDKIFSEIVCELKKGIYKTEIDIARAISKKTLDCGLKKAFSPIVTSGPRAGNEIHPKPTKEKLKGFTIVDFGVRVNGYCSDMTRTIFFGEPSKKDRELYDMVLKGQLIGLASVRDGASCVLADKNVRGFFGKYKKYFIHTLGHGVGKRIHERPRIYEKYDKEFFKTGMVVTIEPGIYISKKLGIRIEDTMVVNTKDVRVYTKSTKKLLTFLKIY